MKVQKYMNEWMNERNKWIKGTNQWTNQQKNIEWTNEQNNVWMNEWKKERKNKWMNELINVQFKCYTWTIKKQQMKYSPTLSTFYSLNNSHRWKILDDKCKYDKWKISKLVWLNEIYIYSIQSSKKGKKMSQRNAPSLI